MQRWISIKDVKHPIDTDEDRKAAFVAMRIAGLRAGLVRTEEAPEGGTSKTKEAEYLFLPEFA